MDLPEVVHEQFASPPLKAMLGQARFPPILKIADPASLAPFQAAIAADFPTLSQEQQVQIVVGPAGGGTGAQKLWRFTSSDRAWSVLLATDALTVEAEWTQYTEYAEWRARFERVWQAALAHLAPQIVLQQGLRYIDHLEKDLAGPEWATWINPDLLGPIRLSRFADSLDHALTDLRFRLEDGILSFKHGIVTLGPSNARGYLLDFDCFTQLPTPSDDPVSLLARFDVFHDIIWRFFRWSLTDEAVELFRQPRDDEHSTVHP
jgi:uncharacterized protein (TIGR04255 family)